MEDEATDVSANAASRPWSTSSASEEMQYKAIV